MGCDIEFKMAKRGVPEDAYCAVSAFANTAGGWIVFVVSQEKGQFGISGVEEVDKVLNDFLSCLHVTAKHNRSIDFNDLLDPLDQGGIYTLSPHLRERYLSTLPAGKADSGQSEGRLAFIKDFANPGFGAFKQKRNSNFRGAKKGGRSVEQCCKIFVEKRDDRIYHAWQTAKPSEK